MGWAKVGLSRWSGSTTSAVATCAAPSWSTFDFCECTPHSHRAGQGATLAGANDDEQEQRWAHEGWCQRINIRGTMRHSEAGASSQAPAAYPPLRLLLVVLSIASVLCQPPARVLEEFSFRAPFNGVHGRLSFYSVVSHVTPSLTHILSLLPQRSTHSPASVSSPTGTSAAARSRTAPLCGSRRRRRPPRGGSRRSSHSR